MTEETILQPDGWFNGINIPDALTANQLDMTHADFTALPMDTQQQIRDMKKKLAQVFGSNKAILRFKPHLEVFHLSKLLVPGIQLQIQMYFNRPVMFMVRFAGAKAIRCESEIVPGSSEGDRPSIYRELTDNMKGGKIMGTPQ